MRETLIWICALLALSLAVQFNVAVSLSTDVVHFNSNRQGTLKPNGSPGTGKKQSQAVKDAAEKKKQEDHNAAENKDKESAPSQITFNAPQDARAGQQEILQKFWQQTFERDTAPDHSDAAAALEDGFPSENFQTTTSAGAPRHYHGKNNTNTNHSLVSGTNHVSHRSHVHRQQTGTSVNVDAEEGEPGEDQVDAEDQADASDRAAALNQVQVTVKPSPKSKDFAFEPSIFAAVGCLVLLLILVQLAVSCIGAVGHIAPVAAVDGLPNRIRDDQDKFENMNISNATFRRRDAPLQFVKTSLRSVMAQVFVVGPVAAFSIMLGHYENFGTNLSVFFTVFGVCALLSLGVFLLIAALSLCIGACKIHKWTTFEKSARNPDQVVWTYASTVAEAKNNPSRCFSWGKQSAMENDIEKMSFLFLRAQIVPLRDYVPNKISQNWEEQFFPRKVDNLERLAHFDMAQYLAVKLTAVWSQLFLFNAWTWLAVGIVLALGMTGEVLLKALHLDDTFLVAAKLTFFTGCALVLIFILLAIHFKLRSIKSHQLNKGMQAVKAKAEQYSSFFRDELARRQDGAYKPSAAARETHHEIWKEFVAQSSLACPSRTGDATFDKSCMAKLFPHKQDRAGLWWFGDRGPCYVLCLLQVVLILASILACTFIWYLIPLVATKWGVVVNVLVDIAVTLLLIKLMIWVPNCLFEIVYTGHAGDNFHDPQVATEIVSSNRARLQLGAQVVFDCVLLDEIASQTVSESDPSDNYEEVGQACFHRLSNGTGRPISLETFATWYNQSIVRSSLTIPAESIMVRPDGLGQLSELDQDQFVRFYCIAREQRRALSMNFDKLKRAIKEAFVTEGQNYLLPEDFMNSLQKHVADDAGLSVPARRSNEIALLAAAELFDVADLQKVYSVVFDKNLLVMVTRMYLFEYDDSEV